MLYTVELTYKLKVKADDPVEALEAAINTRVNVCLRKAIIEETEYPCEQKRKEVNHFENENNTN